MPLPPPPPMPGIEEEYEDLMAQVRPLLASLAPGCDLTQDGPRTRVVLFLMWLEQEVKAGRIPIPLDRSYFGGFARAYVDEPYAPNTLLPITEPLMEKVLQILMDYGLIRSRDYPMLIAMIDLLVSSARREGAPLTAGENDLIDAYAEIAKELQNGKLKPPIKKAPYTQFGTGPQLWDEANADRLQFETPSLLEQRYPDREWYNLKGGIDLCLFGGRRPFPNRKPPLPAPNGGPRPMGEIPASRWLDGPL